MQKHPAYQSKVLLLSRKDLEDIQSILRAEVRAYVDRRVMHEEAKISENVCREFLNFCVSHRDITIETLADLIYRLTLGCIYNCFQLIRKSTRDPSNVSLAIQFSLEIALQLNSEVNSH